MWMKTKGDVFQGKFMNLEKMEKKKLRLKKN
jgi:hypothetical protein